VNTIYSEKEIMIFNGVTKLLNQGIRLHTIKVADIAEAAAIGKGTIYDYFKSKEEIIEKSIIYSFNMEIIKAYEKINAVDGFKNKCYAIFSLIENNERDCSPAGLLMSDLSLSDFSKLLKKHHGAARDRERITRDAISELVTLGIQEGVIKEQADKEYQLTVFLSVILGYINSMSYKGEEKADSFEVERARAYTLLIKGLN
jgi:AcrR family transcriptional regulator